MAEAKQGKKLPASLAKVFARSGDMLASAGVGALFGWAAAWELLPASQHVGFLQPVSITAIVCIPVGVLLLLIGEHFKPEEREVHYHYHYEQVGGEPQLPAAASNIFRDLPPGARLFVPADPMQAIYDWERAVEDSTDSSEADDGSDDDGSDGR